MVHPDESHEGSALGALIARVIAELEDNHELELRTARSRVVGLLCERITEAGLVSGAAIASDAGTRAGFATFLERVAREEIGPGEWQAHVGVHYADGGVEEARRQAVLLHMRLDQGGLAREQAAEYFRALARGLRDAG
jgi:hypothetical protein